MIRPAWRARGAPAPGAKVHNSGGTLGVKVELRREVLREIQPARVLDVYCGPVGEMFARVWSSAESYAGIDREWRTEDARRRYVGDNVRILRALDLAAYNVFDLDAFGSPWEPMVILAARRRWARGERGAVVLTDASSQKGRFGGTVRGIADLLGLPLSGLAPGESGAQVLGNMALVAWAERSRVRPIKRLRFEGTPSKRSATAGSVVVIYSALVFEGL